MAVPIHADLALQSDPDDADVIVIGAGVAGCVAAHGLARRGLRVLLVERSAWPRRDGGKVCGCCLSAAGVAALRRAGLADALVPPSDTRQAIGIDGVQTTRLDLLWRGQRASVQTMPGLAIGRCELDAALGHAAAQAGARFVSGTSARVICERDGLVELTSLQLAGQLASSAKRLVRARCIVMAGGLGTVPGRARAASWFGAGCVLLGREAAAIASFAQPALERGTIAMHVGDQGYLGLVRLRDTDAEPRINIAMALSPAWCRAVGGPGAAAAELLARARGVGAHRAQRPGVTRPGGMRDAGELADVLRAAAWRGTPLLTRSAQRVALGRALAVGDAAGYVEPFTGEGMAWAIQSAAAVVDAAAEMVAAHTSDGCAAAGERWSVAHRRATEWKRARCRVVAGALRVTPVVRVAMGVARAMPSVASLAARRIGAAA